MKSNFRNLALIALVVSLTSIAISQVGMRKSFRADGDNNRNFVNLISNAPLQSIFAMTSSFDCMAEVRLDSIQDSPKFDLNVQLGTLTTGNTSRDMELFSAKFLDWKGATTASFHLLELTPSRNYQLENEKSVPAAGHGTLTIGAVTDTVSVELSYRYLEANAVTMSRLPGDLLHLNGTIYFRQSDFGMMIPQEALLLLDDRLQLHFDVFASTQR